MKVTLLLIGTLASVAALIALSYGGLFVNREFSKVREETRTVVAEESFAYKNGVRREIRRLYSESLKVQEENPALARSFAAEAVIQAERIDINELEPDLQAWILNNR